MRSGLALAPGRRARPRSGGGTTREAGYPPQGDSDTSLGFLEHEGEGKSIKLTEAIRTTGTVGQGHALASPMGFAAS